jgi:hypothetical protein
MNSVDTSGSLFEKAMKAWGVEIRTLTDDEFKIKRELYWKGEKLEGIIWSPEVAQDLSAFHGQEAEANLVEILLVEVFRALAGKMPNIPPIRMCKTCKVKPVNRDKANEIICDECIIVLQLGKGA